MTSATLKNEVKGTQFELGLRLALVLLCTNLVRIDQTFLQILSRSHLAYHLSYVVALNDLHDLKNEVKVTRFELGLHLVLVLQCTNFGEDTSNIS